MKQGSEPAQLCGGFTLRAVALLLGCLCAIAAAVVFKLRPAQEQPQPAMAENSAPAEPTSAASPNESPPGRVVYATWYEVPQRSLAKRRAGQEELTAAHNSLPLGTRVRLTHLANGKTATVRITDRGIRDRKVKIDICKEAAEELGMVGKGLARVRMQVVPKEEPGAAFSDTESTAGQR
jgi:rare lipoprotein A